MAKKDDLFPPEAVVTEEPAVTVSPEELSTNFFWTKGNNEVFNLQTTVRGNPTVTEIQLHMQSVIKGTDCVLAVEGHAKPVGQQTAQVATVVKKNIHSDAESVEQRSDGTDWLTYDACFVRVLPQPDNKVTVEFYGNDHKQPHDDYAFVKVNKWKTEQVAGLMKHITDANMREAADYNINCRVYYELGAEYHGDKGSGRYKDVCHVRLLS
jgi:hypothetical protein